jgi:hypothetical protein
MWVIGQEVALSATVDLELAAMAQELLDRDKRALAHRADPIVRPE